MLDVGERTTFETAEEFAEAHLRRQAVLDRQGRFCHWSGLGRCILPGGHAGDHELELTPVETAYIVAVGTGRLP
jgi:hypothetical protein